MATYKPPRIGLINSVFAGHLFIPPQNRRGVIFLLQFVCLSDSLFLLVCVCEQIKAERMH